MTTLQEYTEQLVLEKLQLRQQMEQQARMLTDVISLLLDDEYPEGLVLTNDELQKATPVEVKGTPVGLEINHVNP